MTHALPDPITANNDEVHLHSNEFNASVNGIAQADLSVEKARHPKSTSAASKLDWNLLETVLADLWTDVLGIPPESLDQSFFAAGGHSLSAVRFFVGIRERFACEVPFRVLFASPTISQIAAYIQEAQPTAGQSLDVQDGVCPQSLELSTKTASPTQITVFPAAYPQRSLWTLDQVNEELNAYNIPLAWMIEGSLDA